MFGWQLEGLPLPLLGHCDRSISVDLRILSEFLLGLIFSRQLLEPEGRSLFGELYFHDWLRYGS